MQASRSYIYRIDSYLRQPIITEERDSCGVGLIVETQKSATHRLVIQALQSLACMEHRGACSADQNTGDGAGITTNIPWDLFENTISFQTKLDKNKVGVAMVFFPTSKVSELKKIFTWALYEENLILLKWREVPIRYDVLGRLAKQTCPVIQQCFVQSTNLIEDDLERALYAVRKKIEKTIAQSYEHISHDFYICSFSSRIIIYKGMMRSAVLGQFFEDLYNPQYKSIFAIYHRRFSTNTMPKWPLAQPMRLIAHNGEINTLLGNLNWMKSREPFFFHNKLANYIEDIKPVTNLENSDSANLDAVVELMLASGLSPEEALMILIPEAYQNQPALQKYQHIVDFYEYYSHLQEPWDGPALVVFTDGKHVGAALDRNGLRPARYCITSDGLVVVGSETGVINLDTQKIIEKGRLGPGQIFSVDMIKQKVLYNLQIKSHIASRLPYRDWLRSFKLEFQSENYLIDCDNDISNLMRMHTAFGYSNEDVELVIEHMASSAKEPTFCMGDDVPLAILSNKPHLIFDYFKQRFAQVTNPPIDPLRENLVMSLSVSLGSKGNLLHPKPNMARSIQLLSPILNELELEKIETANLKVLKITTFFTYSNEENLLKHVISDFCKQSSEAVLHGVEILILTDRCNSVNKNQLFLPPLLLVGAIHHHLIQKHLRQNVSIIIDTGQCWSTHHFACLIGYGASAICPYLAFKTVRQWWYQKRTQKLMEIGKLKYLTIAEAQSNYRVAIQKGLLKILSKMGISLLSSYQGAQIFEILGLGFDIVDLAFKGTISRIGGMLLDELLEEIKGIYDSAFNIGLLKKLPNLGYVQYRPGAEYHVNNPEMSKVLHKAVRSQNSELYDMYKQLLLDRPVTNLRDLLEIKSMRSSININKVESIDSIMKRFCTGGMSLGALSRETHETLAIAMNRIGGKSNSGEGGEDAQRFILIDNVNNVGTSNSFPHLKGLKNNDTANSAIKQIASGRFGVTPQYLVHAAQLEIKMAQGAKPGEGGQLPGKKVSPYIAKLRNCKPGVTLISPPPHHDIYSIEDLAQLIFDLHQINPDAQVSVKLVAEVGVGTVAAGVAKGNADIIQISGHDGGTGASPLSSIKHAGVPWELGLTEVHQLLSSNQLRDRVILRVDGGLRTGKDIILAAILGAEEYGFGTIAMIATGCVMARICHTNNCPVGVATQREDLRNRYPGIPSDLVNFFFFIAQEVQKILAILGYEKLHDIVGNTSLLKTNNNIRLFKTKHLHVKFLLDYTENRLISPLYCKKVPHNNGYVLDDQLLLDPNVIQAIKNQTSISKQIKILNIHRTVGARIAGKIAKMYGNNAFQGCLNFYFQGSAGQSYGAFILKGMHFILSGEANDYVGKGMNGGEIVIMPQLDPLSLSFSQVILGNTCLYGATGGFLFASGCAGERFAVRNSFAQAIVEGVGDHACEYMTGGIVVVIGPAGRNIAAGMTGGLAYFLDENHDIMKKVNHEIVIVQRVLTKEAESQLRNLLYLHVDKTSSQKAQKILREWDHYLSLFWQIVPPSEMDSPITNLQLSEFTSLK